MKLVLYAVLETCRQKGIFLPTSVLGRGDNCLGYMFTKSTL